MLVKVTEMIQKLSLLPSVSQGERLINKNLPMVKGVVAVAAAAAGVHHLPGHQM